MTKKILYLLSFLPLLGMGQNKQFAANNEAKVSKLDSVQFAKLGFTRFKMEEPEVFAFKWDNFECHVDSVDLTDLADTVWICATDVRHKKFTMPVKGALRDDFGWRNANRYHYGVDLKLDKGDTVYATMDGKVRYSKYNYGGYGNLVVVRHYNGLETYYAHLSQLLVDTNEYVKSGMPIGLGGSTGRSTGPHLHFEMRYMGNAINPEVMIDFDKGELKDANVLIHKGLFKYKKELKERKYYRVRSGDTLSAIARKNGISLSSLCKLNGIKKSKVIRPGQNLRVR